MTTLAKLLVSLGLDSSEYSAGLENSVKATEGLSKSLLSIGAVAASVGIAAGAAMVGVGVAAVKSFAGFQKGMAEVFTLMPTASQASFDAMTADVKAFSMEFGVLPEKVIPGLYQALSSGIPADNVFTFLEIAQKAATAGVTDLTVTVDGLTSVVNAYGSDMITAAQASDQMFAAVVFGKTTFEELSSSLFNVNPIAASLGVSFGDVTSAIAAMTAQGVPTAQTTTQLRQMMVELGDSTSQVGKIFEKITGTGFKEFIASGGDVQGALQILESASGGAGKGINELFSSVEAGGAALALTGKGTQLFNNALQATATSAGATDRAFGTMNQTLSASFGKIQAAGAVFLVTIGEKLAPAIAMVANALVGLLQSKGAADFISNLGDGLTFVVTVLTVFGTRLVGYAKLAYSWGSNITAQLAAGIMAAVSMIVNVLQQIGAVIASWLAPGSPPKITPDLERWGTEAATLYFDSWAKGDTSAFKSIASTLQTTLNNLVDVGKFGKEGVIPTMLAGRAGLAKVFSELATLGEVSQSTFDSVVSSMGPAGAQIGGLIRAYSNLSRATRAVESAQDELNSTTEKYAQMLAPLNAEMKALQDREKEIKDMQRIEELNKSLAEGGLSEADAELARNEIAQINLQKQIKGVTEEGDAAKDTAQAKLDAAKVAQTAAQTQVDTQQQAIDNQNETNQLIGQQIALIEQMAKTAASAAAGAKGGGLGGLGGIGAGKGIGGGLPTLAMPVIPPFDKSALEDASKAMAETTAKATAFVDGIQAKFTAFGASMTAIGAPFVSAGAAIGTGFQTIVGIVLPVLQRLQVGFTAGVANIAPQWANLMATLNGLIPVITIIGQVVGAVVLAIVGFIAGALPSAMFVVGSAIQAVLGLVDIATALFMGFVNIIIALLNGDFAGAWNATLTMLNGISAGFMQILGGLVNVVFGLVGGLIDGVIGFFKTLYDTLVGHSIIPDMVRGIISAITGLASDVLAVIGTMASNVLTILMKMGSDAVKAGKAIIDGIKKGITDAWEGMKSWFVDKIKSLLPAGMAGIGASSPSKDFADKLGNVGIMGGIMLGMSQGLPKLLAFIGKAGRKILAETLGVMANFGRSAGLDVFRSLLDLQSVPTFQPLVESTKAFQDAQADATKIAEKLKEVNDQIAVTQGMAESVKNNEKLADLYQKQTDLLKEQAEQKKAVWDTGLAVHAAEALSNEQKNAIADIAKRAREAFEAAQAQAKSMMNIDAKGALEFFNARKAQIEELAALEKEKALATTEQQRADLQTQIDLLQAVQAQEKAQQEVQIYIGQQGGSGVYGDRDIIKIIENALRNAGISVDIQQRTA